MIKRALCDFVYPVIGKCSASAWIMEVGLLHNGSWDYKPLAMGGTFFSRPLSSFLAETLALEECTLFLKRILEKHFYFLHQQQKMCCVS